MKTNYISLKKSLQALDASFAPATVSTEKERKKFASDLKEKEQSRAEILRSLHLAIPQRAINNAKAFNDAKIELERKLNESRNKAANVEKQIDLLNQDVSQKTLMLKNIQSIIDGLEREQKRLQKDIDERGVIEMLWKYFFGDPEKAQLSQVNQDLLCRCKEKKEVISERDRIQQDLDESQRKLTSMRSNLADERKHLEECKSQIAQLQKAIKLEDEIEYLRLLLVNCDSKIGALAHNQKQNKNKALIDLDTACKSIRNIQPQLGCCSEQDFGNTKQYSDMIAYGRLRLNYGNEWRGYIPRLMPFPLKSAVRYGITSADHEWIVNLMLRVFQCMPLGQISMTVIDPIALGKSLPDFQVLLKNRHPFATQRILTRGDEIEENLNQHLLYVENLIQKVFVSGITDWDDYNKKNPNNQLPYKILIIYDIPEQFTEKSALYLTRLIEHGPRCGVLPLLSFDDVKLNPRKHAALLEMVTRKCWKNEEIYKRSSMTSLLRYLSFSEEPEPSYPEGQLEKLFESLAQKFAEVSCFDGKMEDLWATIPIWSEKAISGIEASVGWTAEGNTPVKFTLGDMPSHALLGGKTGSGKSNFIHVLIHSLCHKYSPEELNLYLLDYKEGTEFNIYANPLLPHAKLVATESDIEYGVTVLRHLKEELQRRSDLFKQLGAPDYRDFRRNSSHPLPRILLIVDEFQKLFAGDRNSADEAEKHINDLLRQGRSFGIHVMLATQTIRGLQNQSIGQLVSNLGCRVALSCSAEDSALLLGSSNWDASTLQSPPEGIINSENGIKSANVVFNIPFAKKEVRILGQQLMSSEAQRQGMLIDNKIFNGNTLPNVPPQEEFNKTCNRPGMPLCLGLTHNFESNPFLLDIGRNSLLVAGHSPAIRAGILQSIFKSLNNRIVDGMPMLYFSSSDSPVSGLPGGVLSKDYSWDFADLEQFIAQDGEKCIVIDSFDYAKKIHPSPLGGYKKPGTPESPYDILKRCVDITSGSKCHVIVFVENYRRFSMPAKDLFALFDLRIGFGMNEDDAGNFANSGGFGKLRGLENSSKAIYVNNLTNEQYMIRPFAMFDFNTIGEDYNV